jgi:hypothetical protein
MYKTLLLVSLGLIIMLGCTDDPTPSLYDPSKHGAANTDVPVISNITGSTLAGVGELVISGTNFSTVEPVNVTNQVSFRNAKTDENALATVLSVTPTQMTVASPVIVGDSLHVKVWSSGADPYSEIYYYKLDPAVSEFMVVDDKQGEINFHSVGVTPSGQILLAAERKSELNPTAYLKIINQDGTTDTTLATSLKQVKGLKYGPGNKIYYAYSLRPRQIKTLDLATGVEEVFNTMSAIPNDLDFDPDKNIWVVARTILTEQYRSDVIRVSADGSSNQTELTVDVEMLAVRVFSEGANAYVYFAGNDTISESKIWRGLIQSDGSLGSPEVVLDLNAAAWIDGYVQSITFSATGTMYIATNSDPDAMYVYYPSSGVGEVFYPGLMKPNMRYISWGNGNFMYGVQQLVGGTARLFKIDMVEPGAPYYGRQ